MKNCAICYFSATGNGFYIANELGKYMDSDLYYIPNSFDCDFQDYSTIILVTPVYMFALPNIVKEFVQTLK